MSGVVIKALEWSGPNTLANGQTVWAAIAEGMEFTYSIWTVDERFSCMKVLPQFFDSLEEAKEAVQFNYDERILSALDLSTLTGTATPKPEGADEEDRAAATTALAEFNMEGGTSLADIEKELSATPTNAGVTEAGWWIEERGDDAFIVAPHWNFGRVCVARKPKLMSNGQWRSIAEQIVRGQAALSAAPAGSGVPGMVLVPKTEFDALYREADSLARCTDYDGRLSFMIAKHKFDSVMAGKASALSASTGAGVSK